MRSLEDARVAAEATEEELREAQRIKEWFGVVDRMSGSCYLIQWLPTEPVRLAKHGLSGFARAQSHEIKLDKTRIHLCKRWPCGAKFDNRKEPTLCHGFACRLGDVDGDHGLLAAVPEAVAPALEEVPAESPAPAEVPGVLPGVLPPLPPPSHDPPPPALVEHSPPDIFEAARHPGGLHEDVALAPETPDLEDVGIDPAPGSGGREILEESGGLALDLVPAPAGHPYEDNREEEVLFVRGGARAYRREALALLLEEEAYNCMEAGFYIPLFALMLFAFNRQWRLMVMVGRDLVDVLQTYSPELAARLPDNAEIKTCIGCRIAAEDDSRILQCIDQFDASQINHWVACISAPAGAQQRVSHPCCHGFLCGGRGEPCMGPLLEPAGNRNLIPVPTVSQGDCGIDLCCFWGGLPRDADHHLVLRETLRMEMQAVCCEDLWLDVFDVTMSPAWQDVARDMASETGAEDEPEAVGPSAPAEDRPEPGGSAAAASQPGAGGASASASLAATDGAVSTDTLKAALRWACKLPDSADAELEAMIAGLAPERQRDWVTRWQQHCGKNGLLIAKGTASARPSAPAEDCPEPRGSADIMQAGPKRRRLQYKSYALAVDVARATKFRKLHPKGNQKRIPRGQLANFMQAEGLPASCAYYQHFSRVIRKLDSRTAAPVGFVLVNKGRTRKRFHGRQGNHCVKTPMLKRLLFEWFVGIRARIRGRLPPCLVRQKAMSLRLSFIKEALAQGIKPHVPKIVGTNWIYRWRKLYNISFRKPNKRWKVPRPVLLSRLRIMWLNLIRVRVLAWLCFGVEPRVAAAIILHFPP